MNSLRFFIISSLFILPFFVFAQTATNQSYQDIIDKLLEQRNQETAQQSEFQISAVSAYLDVKINPKVPGPNVPVQITIESYLTDLYKANISWALNGNVISKGFGRTSFTFQNGPSGATTYVFLSFVTNTGELVKKDFSFTPAGVNIMWEADTYTPPFYKGKALISPEAGVRIIALPDLANLSNPLGAGNFVYNWKKDDYDIASASGYGENVYSFTGPKPLTNTKISLGVSSVDESARSEIQIYLPQARPFILFYEKDPLFGVLYNKPIDEEMTLDKKEVSISAEPYFFSNEKIASAVHRYTWSVNGKEVRNNGRVITLRNDTGAGGKSVVSLTMRGISKTFQTARKDVLINFGGSGSSSRPIF